MNNIIIKFLDKEYSIPNDVLTYINLLDFTENVKASLISAFVRKLKDAIQKDDVACLDDKVLMPEIEQQVGRYIAKLCDNGIFNRTISDYLMENKGYQLFSDVNKAALEKMKSLLIREMDSWQAGYENALQKRDSHITGMGFSIWSSSFINHAIYAAMEASTVSKQEKEAVAQYRRDMDELRTRLDSQYSKEKSDYVNNTYIPDMEAALTVFAYELLDKYVADLITNNRFDGKTLEYIDIRRSNELLKNLMLSNNKKAVLENAFVACPYNASVYIQVIKHDLMDYDSFQTAKVFKQSDTILSVLNDNWGEVSFPSTYEINYHVMETLAKVTETTLVDLLRVRTEQYATSVVKAYARIADMLRSKEICRRIIREYTDESILSGDEICKSKASAYVHPIVTETIWLQLTGKCGHDDLLKRIKKYVPQDIQADSKIEIDNYFIAELTDKFEEARVFVVSQIEERRKQEEKQKALEVDQKVKKEREEHERKKRNKKIGAIIGSIIVVTVVFAIVLNMVILPQKKAEVTKRNIELGSTLLGRQFDSTNSVKLSDGEYAFFTNEVELFGMQGRYVGGFTDEGKAKTIIDMLDWTTTQAECDLENLINELIDMYGIEYYVDENHEIYQGNCVNDVYAWMNVSGYKCVMCWENSDGTITIRWMMSY